MRKHFIYLFLHASVLAGLLLVSSSPAIAQEADPSVRASVISLLIPLVLVLAAMVGALILVRRRFSIASGDGPMRVRQILAVGPRERIVLIDVENHSVILGVTGTHVSQIAVLDRVSAPITAVDGAQRKP